MNRGLVIFFFFLLASVTCTAQSARLDSLLNVIENGPQDSLQQQARAFYIQDLKHNYDKTNKYVFEGIEIAKKKHDFYFLGQFNSMAGIMYSYIGMNDSALIYFENSLNYRVYIKDTLGIASSNLGLSNICRTMGDYKSAVQYGLDAERASASINDYSGLARIYNGLGLIFKQQSDFEKAIDYYKKGIEMAVLANDEIIRMGILANIGGAYQEMRNFDTALVYHRQALEFRLKYNDVMGLGISYGNFGLIFMERSEYDSAIFYTNRALQKFGESNYISGIAMCHSSLGNIFQKMSNHSQAIKSFKLAEEYATIGNFLPDIITISQGLARSYEALGKYKESTFYLNQYILLQDSLHNNEKSKEVQKLEIEYEYNQKQLADSLKLIEKEKLAAIEAEKQKQLNQAEVERLELYMWAGVFMIALVTVIVIILWRNNRRQKKFNEIIADQKSEVEEKNKEITDSINYAKRIQEAILPPHKLVEKYLPESFILYKPKDIVAGDFYWFEHHQNLIFIAAADCTGHGVPGAMVSVVCSNALNRTVKEFNIIEPGKILDKVRDLVIETFEKSETDVKDGMDISLCVLNPVTNEIRWAGANNPLWVVAANSDFVELSPDRQPIGKYVDSTPFSTLRLKLDKGDTVYLFTDGYADQFGGEKGKKLKAANLKKLLIDNATATIKESSDNLSKAFDTWKGSLEQVDDVCIIGFRI